MPDATGLFPNWSRVHDPADLRAAALRKALDQLVSDIDRATAITPDLLQKTETILSQANQHMKQAMNEDAGRNLMSLAQIADGLFTMLVSGFATAVPAVDADSLGQTASGLSNIFALIDAISSPEFASQKQMDDMSKAFEKMLTTAFETIADKDATADEIREALDETRGAVLDGLLATMEEQRSGVLAGAGLDDEDEFRYESESAAI